MNGIFLKPQYKVYREPSIFYFNTSFFDVLSLSKIFQFLGLNQQIDKQCCLPPFSLKISLRDTFFNIYLNFLVLSLSRMFIKFSLSCIFHHMWTFFQFRECIESVHFTHASVAHSNSRQNFLKICFPKDKTGGGNYDLLYQSSVRKYEDDLEH